MAFFYHFKTLFSLKNADFIGFSALFRAISRLSEAAVFMIDFHLVMGFFCSISNP